MKKIFFTSAGLLVGLFLFTSCKKDEPKPILTNNKLSTEQDKLVDETLKNYVQRKSAVSLSIGILKDGKISHYGYGELSKGSNAIPDVNSIYEIGSITKTFTAAMVVDLFKEKGLNLNDPLTNFLPAGIPSLIKNGKQLTVQNLLNHTSGLPRLPDDFAKGYDPQDSYKNYDSTRVYNALKTVKLNSTPGEKMAYSNFGFAIAGVLVERISKKPFAQYLEENVTNPLGLTSTKSQNKFSQNIAKGHSSKGKEVAYWSFDGFAGAGCMYSSVSDLLTYAQAFINTENSAKKDMINQVKTVTYQSPEGMKIASAWFYMPVNETDYLFHDGETGGFISFIFISADKKTAMVVLANSADPKINDTVNQLALNILK